MALNSRRPARRTSICDAQTARWMMWTRSQTLLKTDTVTPIREFEMNELPTHKQATAIARLERKAREQAGVAKPQFRGDCWAEKRVYAGQMFPSYVHARAS